MATCRGCLSYDFEYPVGECALTKTLIRMFPDCPCLNCLVKVVCNEVCEDLANLANRSGKAYMKITAGEGKI